MKTDELGQRDFDYPVTCLPKVTRKSCAPASALEPGNWGSNPSLVTFSLDGPEPHSSQQLLGGLCEDGG